MATFTEQIQYYTGDTALTMVDNNVEQWFNDGITDVIARVEKMMPEKLNMFSSTQSVPESGLDLTSDKVYNVTRGIYPCEKIPVNLAHKAIDSNSIYEATATSPVYYIRNSKLHVLPSPGSTTAQPVGELSSATINGVDLVKIQSANHPFSNGEWVYLVATGASGDWPSDFASWETGTIYPYQVLSATTSDFIIEYFYEDIVAPNWAGDGDIRTPQINIYQTGASADTIVKGVVNNDTGTISNFPSTMYRLPVLFTAANIMFSKLTDIRARIAVEIENNLDEADSYIKSWAATGDDFDFRTMMEDEDTELASLALSGAQTQFANANARLSQLTSDYNWALGQLQYIKGLYNEGFVEISRST